MTWYTVLSRKIPPNIKKKVTYKKRHKQSYIIPNSCIVMYFWLTIQGDFLPVYIHIDNRGFDWPSYCITQVLISFWDNTRQETGGRITRGSNSKDITKIIKE